MPSRLLARAELEGALDALSARLVERDTAATIVLFGDAAMMFAHDARTEIDHIDAVLTPRGPVLGAARDVSGRLDLPANWITDQAAGAVPKDLLDGDVVDLWERPNLAVRALGAELLLAMRALAPDRPEDREEIVRLATGLGLTSSIDVEVLVAELFPGRTLNAKARAVLDDLL
jgi:hypothetical protein